MTSKQATVRLPAELADKAEAIARVRNTSVNAVIVDALTAEVERVRTGWCSIPESGVPAGLPSMCQVTDEP